MYLRKWFGVRVAELLKAPERERTNGLDSKNIFLSDRTGLFELSARGLARTDVLVQKAASVPTTVEEGFRTEDQDIV